MAQLRPIHEVQLLSYLKLSGSHAGRMITLGVILLNNGIRRFVDQLPEMTSALSAPSAVNSESRVVTCAMSTKLALMGVHPAGRPFAAFLGRSFRIAA